MAKARKLPSGSWNCQVYTHTDEKGKKHFKSFTVKDSSEKGKRKCEAMALQWSLDNNNTEYEPVENISLNEATECYIETKRNVLSISTISGYEQIKRNSFGDFGKICIYDISNRNLQIYISNFARTHSPKTVRNVYSLITAVLNYYNVDTKLNVRLPQAIKPNYNLPTEQDLVKIIELLKVSDRELLKAVYLAAFGTLRRSEICALTSEDVVGNTIIVNKALVSNKKGDYILKTTKTVSSDRVVELPQFVIDELPKEGRLVNLLPDNITNRFARFIRKHNFPLFRFHDLRAFSASIAFSLGVPTKYIQKRGGWETDTVLKNVYSRTIDEYEHKFTNLTNEYFSKFDTK